jgi:hypothetical protein
MWTNIVDTFKDFLLDSNFHDICRRVEGILIEVAILAALVIGLWRIIRALIRDGKNETKRTKGKKRPVARRG